MDVLRSQVEEFKGAVPREHPIYSPNERTYIKMSTSGNDAKVVTFKPDGKGVIERLTHDPNPATNELAGATKWKSSGSKQLGRVGAGIERARAVASSPLGEFAAQSGAGKGTALLSLARRGVEVGVRTGLGILAAVGSFAGGVQIGTGINQMSEGKTAEGAINIGEGTANLGLSIGTMAFIKSGALIAEGGIAAGSLATAAGLAAGGSVILVAETVRAAVQGAETPIDVADKYYGTHFGDIYGWVTGAYSKK